MNPKLIAACGAATVLLSLTSWALLERGWRLEAEAKAITLAAQGQIVADAVKQCSAGAAHVKDLGDKAVAAVDELLGRARAIATPKWRTVEKIEMIIERPAPPGVGCEDAWAEIETAHKKAGATP